MQGQIDELLVKSFVIMALLPLRVFENPPIKLALQTLNPRVTLPSHQKVAAIVSKLDMNHLTSIKEALTPFHGLKCGVLEFDCWPAPTEEHYLGVFFHGLTAAFEPVTLLLYAAPLRVEETAVNTGQRIIWICKEIAEKDVSELCWAVQSDNTGKAANVANCLALTSLRCLCHIFALGPARLLHPRRRQVEGRISWVMDDNAEPTCYELLERIRRLVKYVYNRESVRQQLGRIALIVDVKYLVFDLDSTSKWKSTVNMLIAITRGEKLLSHWFIDYGADLPEDIILNDDDFKLAREIVGVLRPVSSASLLMESDAYKGSSALPWLGTDHFLQNPCVFENAPHY